MMSLEWPILFELLSSLILLCWLWPLFGFIKERRRHLELRKQPINAAVDQIPLSVIVPVRNEAAGLERTLTSLLKQEYSNLQVVVVNDRSTDNSGEVLERLSAEHTCLHVINLEELPAGWLGKCHALHVGAREARGDYLLFADADVDYAPDALLRAMSLVKAQQADHLAVAPYLASDTSFGRALMACFGLMFSTGQRLWRINRDDSSAFVGVGAFNLVRQTAYEAIGGHTALKTEVVDDVGLGYLVRRAGFRQRLAWGGGVITVKWAKRGVDMLQLSEKNGFAFVGFRLGMLINTALVTFITTIGPFAGLLLPQSLVHLALSAATVGLIFSMFRLIASWYPWWVFLWGPLGFNFVILALLRSAFLCIRRRGVWWRDTFYPLDELRRGMVFPRAGLLAMFFD